MISFSTRTVVGSYTVLKTKSFICGISTLPGFFRGSIAVMRADTNGEIVKWPPVGKAYFWRGLTRVQRDTLHDYISTRMNEVGDSDAKNPLAGIIDINEFALTAAMEGVFSVAEARGMISKYIIDKRPVRR